VMLVPMTVREHSLGNSASLRHGTMFIGIHFALVKPLRVPVIVLDALIIVLSLQQVQCEQDHEHGTRVLVKQ
jgi:hypothetical protein